MTMRTLLLIIAGLLVADTAAAEPPGLVGGSEVISMITSMFIVLAVILALGWLYSRSRLAVSGQKDVIQVIASRALGTKERLLVIDVAGKQLLVGMTSTSVQTLHVFDEAVVVDDATPSTPAFAQRLKATLGDMRK